MVISKSTLIRLLITYHLLKKHQKQEIFYLKMVKSGTFFFLIFDGS